jgi:hypothetical protein
MPAARRTPPSPSRVHRGFLKDVDRGRRRSRSARGSKPSFVRLLYQTPRHRKTTSAERRRRPSSRAICSGPRAVSRSSCWSAKTDVDPLPRHVTPGLRPLPPPSRPQQPAVTIHQTSVTVQRSAVGCRDLDTRGTQAARRCADAGLPHRDGEHCITDGALPFLEGGRCPPDAGSPIPEGGHRPPDADGASAFTGDSRLGFGRRIQDRREQAPPLLEVSAYRGRG